ncbi:hypothetical protein LTR48_006935 [Friedmanniomyces endolithicus]|nr:hypothetical protein LTR48_006935 [Friedmanniomyces endolithicus]
MKNVNVEIAATKRVYQRFEEVEPKHIGETTPGWRWCMNPECRAGRVHEPEVIKAGPKKAKKRVGFFFSKALDATLLSAGIVLASAAGTDSTASATHGRQEYE